MLKESGFQACLSEGTFFVLASFPFLNDLSDEKMAIKLVEEAKVATIPPSAFYKLSKEGGKFLRFCFAKELSELEKAKKSLIGFYKNQKEKRIS